MSLGLQVGELSATATVDASVMRLTLTGTADAAVERDLGELLGRLHGESQRAGVGEVAVDLRALEFMNSSCFKAFITWIIAVDHSPPARRHLIRFLCNPALHWQRRSLKAMVHFGTDIVTVEGG